MGRCTKETRALEEDTGGEIQRRWTVTEESETNGILGSYEDFTGAFGIPRADCNSDRFPDGESRMKQAAA